MKTLNIKKALSALLVMLMLTFAVAMPAFAAGPDAQPAETAASQSAEAAQAEAEGMTTAGKAIACAVAVGIAAAGGAVGTSPPRASPASPRPRARSAPR